MAPHSRSRPQRGSRRTVGTSVPESASANGEDEDKKQTAETGFVEPELSNSSIVTGQRMEDPPTVKIKKELGAFAKGGRAKDPPDVEEDRTKYTRSLYDHRSHEESASLSSLRSSLKRKAGDVAEASGTDEKKQAAKETNGTKKRPYKRKTNASADALNEISKQIALDALDQTPNASSSSPTPSTTPAAESTALNNDYCSCCGMTGMFLCCESCPKSYHFQCINPPVDRNNLPEFWHCKECIKKKAKSLNLDKPLMLNVGIYSKLFDSLLFQDPISFQLPKEIIESFQGVSVDRLGDYNDDSFKPTKSYKQLIKEAEDPLNNVYDKDNNPYFCYNCGGSGLHKEIINCDYCSLSWHLDCLDPPMTSIKKLGSKWKCPNHVDDLGKPRRRFKDQTVVQVSSIKNFENSGALPIDANIEINNVEDKLAALKNNIKLLHDNSNSNLKFSNLTFQVNEEDVVLNFINSTKIKRVNEKRDDFQLLMNLQPSLKDYVASLSKLSNRSLLDNDFKLLNLQELLKITDDELRIANNDFTNDELKEFMMIKRLMQRKGKAKLLEFLSTT